MIIIQLIAQRDTLLYIGLSYKICFLIICDVWIMLNINNWSCDYCLELVCITCPEALSSEGFSSTIFFLIPMYINYKGELNRGQVESVHTQMHRETSQEYKSGILGQTYSLCSWEPCVRPEVIEFCVHRNCDTKN